MNLQRHLDDDAALDGISRGWSRFLTLAPVVGAIVLVAVYAINSRLFYWLLLEDHPVEWLQFGALVIATLAAAAAAYQLARSRRREPALVMGLAALGALGLTGEEISWGERVLRLVPPTDLAALNVQQELNVHNLMIDGVSFNQLSTAVEVLLGLTGLALSLLVRAPHGRWRSTWLSDVAPPLVTVPGFALLVLYALLIAATNVSLAPAMVLQEWPELGFYIAIAVTTVCCYARAAALRRATRRRHAAPRSPVATLLAGIAVTLLITTVFALLTARSGILPGNVPPSMADIYRAL